MVKRGFRERPGPLVEELLRDLPSQGAGVSQMEDHLQQRVKPNLLPQIVHHLLYRKLLKSWHEILVRKAEEVEPGGELHGGPVNPLAFENMQEELERLPGEILHWNDLLFQASKKLCLHRNHESSIVRSGVLTPERHRCSVQDDWSWPPDLPLQGMKSKFPGI